MAVDPVSSPVEAIRQSVYFVDRGNKTKLLSLLMDQLGVKNALVFTRTKHGANKVARDLVKAGITAAAIHGNKSQTARQQALADFKSGAIRCLVATDIAARGLDIEELSHVFNSTSPRCLRPTSTASAVPAGRVMEAPPWHFVISAKNPCLKRLKSSLAAPFLW